MQTTACSRSEDYLVIFYRTASPLCKNPSSFLPSCLSSLLLLILVGTTLILVAVVADSSLHKPMYLWWCRPPTWLLIALANIYNCFCDCLAMVQASCSDPTPQTLMGCCIAMVVSFLPLLLVLLSYAHILASVLRIRSREGRSKAFSICSSHLLVVGTYYSSVAIAYVAYRADLPLDFQVMGNVVFSILTPVLNPLIYTLRNKDVKAAITEMAHPWGPKNTRKP